MNNSHFVSQLLESSADELTKLSKTFDYPSFSNFIDKLNDNTGKFVVTGVGKSGIVARKLVATLNAVSMSSVFLDSGDAVHGDIGVIQDGDALIIISKSGNTEVLLNIAKLALDRNATIFLVCNNKNNLLSKLAHYIIDLNNDSELDKLNLIPTISVLLQLVVCDALVFSLMSVKEAPLEVFMKNHPKGSIGKRHHIKVVNCTQLDDKISVSPDDLVSKGITMVSKTRKGAVVVIENNRIEGIITDGDIRRMLEKYNDISNISCRDVMSSNPLSIKSNEFVQQALNKMNENKVSQLVVVEQDKYMGLIHMHDLL
jgi:arabinose-5-phosphate isomerase